MPTAEVIPASMHTPMQQQTPQEEQQQQEQQQQTPEEDEYLLSCRCDSARIISTLLRCLVMDSRKSSSHHTQQHSTSSSGHSSANSRNKMQPVTVVCHPTSLTFHVQGAAKTSHASVDLQAGIFVEYRVSSSEKDPTFCVNLVSVLECLHVLGTQHLERTKVGLSYNATQQVLHMELLVEDGSVLSTASIPGMLLEHDPVDSVTSLAVAFGAAPIAARLLVQSEFLKEALQELEHYQVTDPATRCTVAISASTGLELAVVGHAAEVVLSLLPPQPDTGSSCLLSLECQSPQARTYPLHALWLGMRGLDIAQETCISINQAGMIAIQHQVLPAADETVGDGSPSFVDFLLLSLHQDEEHVEEPGQVGSKSGVARDVSPHSPRAHRTPQAPRGTTGGNLVLNDSDESSDSDHEEEHERPLSAAPLFGTVVGDGAGRPRRRQRRLVQSSDIADDDDSDRERELDEMSDDAVSLDVAGPTSRPEDPPSSPELVYGEE